MKLNFLFFVLKTILFKWVLILKYSLTEYFNFYLYLKNNNVLCLIMKVLKKNMFLQVSTLTDVCVIDRLFSAIRYELIYNLLSINYNFRIFLKLDCGENMVINSLSNIFLSSSWIEREIWDMFGIIFINNIDLRRILSDYGFEGHPLKKDFPLTGFVELQYDDNLLTLKYVPIELAQDFRNFNFLSPWEELLL